MNPKHRPFCCSVKGHVKMLRLALTATSMTFFIISQAPEPYIVITGFEVTIIFFFIVLYMLRLDRVITFLFWPLLDIINSLVAAMFMIIISVLALIPETTTFTVLGGDLINSFITTVFLLIVAILTIQEKERRHLFYVGGALSLAAAIVCLVDATLVTKMVRKAMKKALGLEGEAKASPAGEESHQPPKPESEKMLSPAPSEPPTVGPALAKEADPAP
ncbi:chemokine-like factor isoform X3 [Eptesicus fuscus]|uniref:chemokine-like factor isoform X3 n=1 Tax=Eptesicus fuscus TaxID=29078 RepID=UPI0024048BAA|nr:chemokine-like factor isoform X3 [Eptesicus fuscus]